MEKVDTPHLPEQLETAAAEMAIQSNATEIGNVALIGASDDWLPYSNGRTHGIRPRGRRTWEDFPLSD